MRTRLAVLVVAVALVGALPAPASAQAAPPPGAISDNVEFIANIQLPQTISAAFMDNTLFVSTVAGLFIYGISDPSAPQLLSSVPMPLWENEDMSIDTVNKLVFLARDPRQAPGVPSGALPYGGVHIIDVANPHAPVPVNFIPLPAGHTSSCVNDCDFLWTGGPLPNQFVSEPGWKGRPIYGTDITDPLNPVQCPTPIDLGRNDGETDYAHDVQVDDMGIAWVSGGGGVRGYWTDGEHFDPLTGTVRTATACDPVPYAGGGTPNEATPSRFMHNAWRDLDAQIPGDDASKGMVLYATEEAITSSCATSGRFATYDLRGSLGGEGWRHDPDNPFRMTVLDTWTPEQQEGATGCASAHYLDDRGDGLLAYSFYEQGTRFLDVSDPADIRQVGYFRPNGGRSFATYWREGPDGSDLAFVTDSSRGVDILRYTDPGAPSSAPTVSAPRLLTAPATLPMDPAFGYLCPLPLT